MNGVVTLSLMTDMNDFCLFSWYIFMDSKIANHHHLWDNMLFYFFASIEEANRMKFLKW